MSIRRAPRLPASGPAGPVGPVGRLAAAHAAPSLFERTLVKEAINAHLKNVTRRLKREPISQVNPFLVGKQDMIIKQVAEVGQLNPWLADFRDRLFKAQEEALDDDKDLRKEIEDYQLVIQDLREQLTKSKDDGDAKRTAQIEALEKALEEETKQVQTLIEEREGWEDLEYQYDVVSGQLEKAQKDLQSSEDKVRELEAEIVRLTVDAAVARSEIDSMEEKLKEAERMEALTAAERETLKMQVEVATRELSEMEETLKEYQAAAERAQSQFDDELARNKTLVEELQTRRETLERETSNLKRLVGKDAREVDVLEKLQKVADDDDLLNRTFQQPRNLLTANL
jgi:chromosome segregation protein